jgi:S1-C subfamily serine protease
MRKCGAFALAICFALGSNKPKEITPHEIFVQYKQAVVRIFVNGAINGCGFVVSSDGLIATANHVVTAEESGGTKSSENIEIQFLGEKRSHFATVLANSAQNDTAILRIPVDGLPHVELGDTSSVKEGDSTTLITYWPDGNLPLLITGPVSLIGPIGPIGGPQISAVISQLPVRKGFSGSPIFDAEGKVIGIVTTRLVGISKDLETARQQLNEAKKSGAVVQMVGVDFGVVTRSLIDSLDSDLVSGLGSAVNISYSEQMIKEINSKKQQPK